MNMGFLVFTYLSESWLLNLKKKVSGHSLILRSAIYSVRGIWYNLTTIPVAGMKNEWATVKNSKLYVGSHGKEQVWLKSHRVDISSMWVKTIDKSGSVQHLNWTENFIKVRAAVGIHFPGYMTHEAVEWSDLRQRWFFLPRKASVESYDTVTDERKATNLLLSASPDFDDIKVNEIIMWHATFT